MPAKGLTPKTNPRRPLRSSSIGSCHAAGRPVESRGRHRFRLRLYRRARRRRRGRNDGWFHASTRLGGAIVLDVLAAGLGGRLEGWNVHPDLFTDRHGLFVIIAVGESLIVADGGQRPPTRSARR